MKRFSDLDVASIPANGVPVKVLHRVGQERPVERTGTAKPDSDPSYARVEFSGNDRGPYRYLADFVQVLQFAS